MKTMKFLKYKLIKMLGGYTQHEMNRAERKYQALLDSKMNTVNVKICNEYIYRMLMSLQRFAQKDLYGKRPEDWCDAMYNVIHNNLMRLICRYLYTDSPMVYSIDNTLVNKDQFLKIVSSEMHKDLTEDEFDDIFILEND